MVLLLGRVREGISLYGSGGFISYDYQQLDSQLGGWAERGFQMVKMKIGTHPDDDVHRVSVARKAIGKAVKLFVDANGAYSVSAAIRFAEQFDPYNVRWFEKPVSSDDLAGLRQVRERAPRRHGYRWRRIWLQRPVLPADAGRRGGQRSAGGSHALRRHQRLP